MDDYPIIYTGSLRKMENDIYIYLAYMLLELKLLNQTLGACMKNSTHPSAAVLTLIKIINK